MSLLFDIASLLSLLVAAGAYLKSDSAKKVVDKVLDRSDAQDDLARIVDLISVLKMQNSR